MYLEVNKLIGRYIYSFFIEYNKWLFVNYRLGTTTYAEPNTGNNTDSVFSNGYR
jgi:hypothetical protein